jgi:hypothetical protein
MKKITCQSKLFHSEAAIVLSLQTTEEKWQSREALNGEKRGQKKGTGYFLLKSSLSPFFDSRYSNHQKGVGNAS